MKVFIGSGPKAIPDGSPRPTLHQRYSVEQAVAAFEPAGTPKFLCDQQFVVMATVGDSATQTHVSAASRAFSRRAESGWDSLSGQCVIHGTPA
jgi:hypothetical protein